MSAILATFSRTAIETFLDMLVPLLLKGAGNDMNAAREEALAMIGDYRPQTREELRLVSEILCFGLQALGALRQATLPGTAPAMMLELLKVGNVLRRNEATAQRKLDALRRPARGASAQSRRPSVHDRAWEAARPHLPSGVDDVSADTPDSDGRHADVSESVAEAKANVAATLDQFDPRHHRVVPIAEPSIAHAASPLGHPSDHTDAQAEALGPLMAAYLADVGDGMPASGPRAEIAALVLAAAAQAGSPGPAIQAA
jgi:hypothetical protein